MVHAVNLKLILHLLKIIYQMIRYTIISFATTFCFFISFIHAQCTPPTEPNPLGPFSVVCGDALLIEPTGSVGTYAYFSDALGTDLLHVGSNLQLNSVTNSTTIYVGGVIVDPPQVFNFTNSGASGRIGPTQAQVDAAYAGTNLDGQVTVLGSGIQQWEVPTSGTYIIEAYGAQGGGAGGGSAGGKGAKVIGEFTLTAGDRLDIIVGQEGRSFEAATNRFQASGGGGSFVVFENAVDENDILVIAGGGGGFAFNRTTNNVDGQIGTAGGNGSGATSGSNGGTNGNGGLSNAGGTYGGGGGFSGNGATVTTRGGRSFLNGGEGGTGSGTPDLEGGFGGGGGVTQVNTNSNRRAGGGGGYSGGGAAHSTNTGTTATAGAAAGGGGSYNNGTNQDMEEGFQEGNGLVVITFVPELCVSNLVPAIIDVTPLDEPDAIAPISALCGDQVTISPSGSSGVYGFYADALGENLLGGGSSFTTDPLAASTTLYVGAVSASVDGVLGEDFLFTHAGASGRLGPDQTQIDAAYAGTNLDGQVTVLGSGIQEWEVPQDGIYYIEAFGAQGGGAGGVEGGKGAHVAGEFSLTAGQKLNIIVGQEGRSFEANTRRWQASGGGGSFVVFENAVDENDILVIAGGGGGHAADRTANNADGQITEEGGNGSGATSGSNGGSNGDGGASNAGGTYGGGGGFIENGATATTRGGRSFLNGGEGGIGTGTPPLEGGFGGGGGVTIQSSSDNNRRAAGGGGYSGGGAAHSTNSTANPNTGAAAGGGGSYNNGVNQIMVAGANEGNGRVVIRMVAPPCKSSLIPVDIVVDPLPSPDPLGTINTNCGSPAVIEPTGATNNFQFYTDAAGNNMVGVGPSFTTGPLFDDTVLYVATIPNEPVPLNIIESFEFTNAGATGHQGPEQSDVNTAYSGTNLDGLVTINERGIQEWEVPVSGLYRINAVGASGAVTGNGAPGLGASLEGTFFLNAGQILQIVVGQEGRTGSSAANGGGGGGGSFIALAGAQTDADLLMAAAGGGTCVNKPNNGIADGKITPEGSDGESGSGFNSGGFDGRGGEGQQNTASGGGGFGGLTSCPGHLGEPNCGDSWNASPNSSGQRAAGFVATGLTHGERARGGTTGGGFGGGGGANVGDLGRVGGGGGYSGGGGGFISNGTPACSGGGGSFNAGTNQNNIAGINSGHGSVTISRAESICVSDLIPVNIVVDDLNPPTITGDAIICQDQSVTLTAAGGSGTIEWYADPAGTVLLDTGNVFVTPVLTTTTTFYAKEITFDFLVDEAFNFNNAGQTGRSGPNQSAINAAYAGTNLDGQVTVTTPGIQEWEVPVTGLYRIRAAGASGAPIGSADQIGFGAQLEGIFELTAGQRLNIAVGQEGIVQSPYGGGGGGTFVVFDGASDDGDILVIAGGGGSCFGKTNDGSAHGQITTNASDGDRGSGVYTGGFDGRGGEGQQNTVGGGGGYGGLTLCAGHPGEPDCGDAFNNTTNDDNRRGAGFLSTSAQSDRGTGGNTNGGFGGGGGYNGVNQSRIGGGGGYSGGGAGFTNSASVCSGGGGSFNAGDNQNNLAGVNEGHGFVTIERLEIEVTCESPLVPFEIVYDNSAVAPTIAGGGVVCLGQDVVLTGSGSTVPVSQWEWYENSVSGSPIATGQNPITVSPSTTTDYLIQIPSSGVGCPALVSSPVTVTVPTPINELSGDNVSATCVVNQNGWVHFLDEDGRLIASVNSNGQDLGSVTATSFIQGSPLEVADCANPSALTAVLDRHWVINPDINNPGANISVRLPLLGAELSSLETESQANQNQQDDVFGISDVDLTKYAGPQNIDNDFVNNCVANGGSGDVQLFVQGANGLVNSTAPFFAGHPGDHLYVEYEIPSFSEFWLHGSNGLSALPVYFSSFSVRCENEFRVIEWVTETEQNTSHFELLKSYNGSDWKAIKSVPAAGNSPMQQTYKVIDRSYGKLVYYQLIQHDLDGRLTKLNPISSQCDFSGEIVELFPNPVSDILMINYKNTLHNVSIDGLSFIDAQGRVVNVDYTLVTSNQAQVNVNNLVTGGYVVKIVLSNGAVKYEKFTKL
jgi:hypothetical protein